MARFPPIVTARELLDQVVDSLRVKPGKSRLEQPLDCGYMSLLTDATNPYPLHLVIGADCLSWVRKYGYYYSSLGMKTAFLCSESSPLTLLLALISLSTGIPQRDLLSLHVSREHFEVLNRALEQFYVADPLLFESSWLGLDGLIALIRHLKKQHAVEVVIVDALQRVRFDRKTPATRAEQRLISSVLRATAHAGRLHIVAGFNDPYLPFPDLPSDSAFYCDSGQDETTKAEPRRIAIASLAMATTRWIKAVCKSLFRRIMPLTKQG